MTFRERVTSGTQRVTNGTLKGDKPYTPIEEGTKENQREPNKYTAAFEILSEIPGYVFDGKEAVNYSERMEKAGISPELAETTANSMLSKLEYFRGKWRYTSPSGTRSFKNLYATLLSWCKMAKQDNRSPPSGANGRRNSNSQGQQGNDDILRASQT